MQQTQQRVILLGDSLILAGVQARLTGVSGLEVIALGRSAEATAATISALHPAVVIFDLGEGQPDFPLSLLHHPDLLLVGINPETHQALVWSGQIEAVQAASDLLGLIQHCGKS